MVIGNGQIAQRFKSLKIDDVCIFASGVSNSNCNNYKEFEREKKLLLDILKNYKDKKIIYFSSCALSSSDYLKKPYYIHKKNMEEMIITNSKNYYIFRLPQLFGDLRKHPTLINFLYYSIINKKKFIVYSEAYRYVIEINDVYTLVENFLKYHKPNLVIDLANNYRYKVIEIVKIFEKLIGIDANYQMIDKYDGYFLDLKKLEYFIEKYNINLNFGQSYLENKLSEKIKTMK